MSDTNPLPVAQLLALCDEVVYAVERHALQVPEKIAAYRAARAASPVTLEEAVLAEYHNAKEAERDMKMAGLCPDRCNPAVHHRRVNAETAVSDNARRLAGEGGA